MATEDDDDQTISSVSPVGPMRQGSVELAYSEVSASQAALATPWRAIDICTKNTIYALDARLRCTAVIDRTTGEPKAEHPFIGALLVGGAARDAVGRLLAVAHPLPEVAMLGVFQGQRGGKTWYNETSEVTRIIIRQRVVTFPPAAPAPRWEDITGSGRRTRPGVPEF